MRSSAREYTLIDPYLIARAIGIAVPLSIVAYVLTRRLCGPPGAATLERLKRSAGVGEERSIALLVLRDWLPWAVAAGVGVVSLALSLVLTFVSVGPRGFGPSDLPRLKAAFLNGCKDRCAGQGANTELCESVCDCSLNELRRQSGTDADLVEWFSAAQRDGTRLQEVEIATKTCVERLRHAPGEVLQVQLGR
jgi:hypothetical protein